MENMDALRSAVLGAQQQGSPASPLGAFPELAKLYQSSFQLPLSNAATQAQGYNLTAKVQNDQEAQEAALREKAQQLKDLQDPGKYQQLPKDDGGYAFLDPTGKEISAFEYSRITGQSPDKILSQSQNPIDVGFMQDYQNLQDYLNAKVNANNDDEASGIARQIEETVKKNQGVDLSKMRISDVIKRFQQAYPTVFGLKQAGVKAGTTFLPSSRSAASSLEQYDLPGQ